MFGIGIWSWLFFKGVDPYLGSSQRCISPGGLIPDSICKIGHVWSNALRLDPSLFEDWSLANYSRRQAVICTRQASECVILGWYSSWSHLGKLWRNEHKDRIDRLTTSMWSVPCSVKRSSVPVMICDLLSVLLGGSRDPVGSVFCTVELVKPN